MFMTGVLCTVCDARVYFINKLIEEDTAVFCIRFKNMWHNPVISTAVEISLRVSQFSFNKCILGHQSLCHIDA